MGGEFEERGGRKKKTKKKPKTMCDSMPESERVKSLLLHQGVTDYSE